MTWPALATSPGGWEHPHPVTEAPEDGDGLGEVVRVHVRECLLDHRASLGKMRLGWAVTYARRMMAVSHRSAARPSGACSGPPPTEPSPRGRAGLPDERPGAALVHDWPVTEALAGRLS